MPGEVQYIGKTGPLTMQMVLPVASGFVSVVQVCPSFQSQIVFLRVLDTASVLEPFHKNKQLEKDPTTTHMDSALSSLSF
jgi:hypothetical protein